MSGTLASKALVTRGVKPRVLGIDAVIEGDVVTCASIHVEEGLEVGPAEFVLYVDEDGPGQELTINWFGLPASPTKRTELPGGRVILPLAKETGHDEEKQEG